MKFFQIFLSALIFLQVVSAQAHLHTYQDRLNRCQGFSREFEAQNALEVVAEAFSGPQFHDPSTRKDLGGAPLSQISGSQISDTKSIPQSLGELNAQQRNLLPELHFEINKQIRLNAARKYALLKFALSEDGEKVSARRAAREATSFVCGSGCSSEIRTYVLTSLTTFLESEVKAGLKPLGLKEATEILNTNYQGLNSILDTKTLPIEENYRNYTEHFGTLLDSELGPLMLTHRISQVAGEPLIESEVECDKTDCDFGRRHKSKIHASLVDRAFYEFRDQTIAFWSSRKAERLTVDDPELVTQLSRLFFESPLAVAQVMREKSTFLDLLCPLLNETEKFLATEYGREQLIGQAYTFTGRVGFWLASGAVGFGAMLFGSMLSMGVMPLLLLVATTIMTVLTVTEVIYRSRLISKQTSLATGLQMQIQLGNQDPDRFHRLRYLREQIRSEVKTRNFIVVYEVLTSVASFGAGTLLVKLVPRTYKSENQLFKLFTRVGRDSKFTKFVAEKYGVRDATDMIRIWKDIPQVDRTKLIMMARSESFMKNNFLMPYFLKEVYDAWHFYPNVIPMPGMAPIECASEGPLSTSPLCFTYCQTQQPTSEYGASVVCENL